MNIRIFHCLLVWKNGNVSALNEVELITMMSIGCKWSIHGWQTHNSLGLNQLVDLFSEMGSQFLLFKHIKNVREYYDGVELGEMTKVQILCQQNYMYTILSWESEG